MMQDLAKQRSSVRKWDIISAASFLGGGALGFGTAFLDVVFTRGIKIEDVLLVGATFVTGKLAFVVADRLNNRCSQIDRCYEYLEQNPIKLPQIGSIPLVKR